MGALFIHVSGTCGGDRVARRNRNSWRIIVQTKLWARKSYYHRTTLQNFELCQWDNSARKNGPEENLSDRPVSLFRRNGFWGKVSWNHISSA